MARLFNGSSDYLQVASAVVTAYPFSFAAWFYPAATGSQMSFLCVGSTADSATIRAQLRVSPTNQAVAETRGSGTNATATTSTTATTNTWNHAAATFTSAQVNVWLNGGANNSNNSVFAMSSLAFTTVGARGFNGSSPDTPLNGRLAEVAVWNVALTAAEIAALARRVTPWRVRSASLVGYWPLWGLHSPEMDLVRGARNLAVTGATWAGHAPVGLFT